MRDHMTGPGYEITDVKPRGIIIFLIGLAAVTLIAVVLLRAVFSMLEARAVRHDGAETAPAVHEAAPRGETGALEPPWDPLLQANPGAALAAMRAEEARILGTYGWVSREAGVARIPIDRAMALVLERGLPARASVDGRDGAAIGASSAGDGSRAGDAHATDATHATHEAHGAQGADDGRGVVASDVIPRDSNSGRALVPR